MAKDIVAEERVEDALPPIEAVMYHEKHHLNAEAVDEIQAYRSAGALGDGYTEKMDRRLLWKIDFRLIPMLAIIYGICVIDRYPHPMTCANGSVNMGYAKVAGMGDDLGLNIGARYSICLLVFFPPYMLFEIPSNMFLVRFGVWKTMTFLIMAWGLIVLGMGFVHTWV
jgi:hypothetical protein